MRAPRTYRDHLRGYYVSPDGEKLDYVPGGEFQIEVGECERTPGRPVDEAIRAARLIRESTREDLWLCMSGGVDSECMARAFLAAGIPFSAAILRFSRGLNEFDIADAVRYCEERGIPFRLFDLDVESFYLGGRHFEIAHRYRCVSPQLTAHLELMSRVPGFPVLSWNPTHPTLVEGGQVSLGMPLDLYFSYHRFLDLEKRDGAAFFFLYTPELFFSFLRLACVQGFIHQRGRAKGLSMGYRGKCDAYRAGGFPIANREDKFTGFEEVKKFFDRHFGEESCSFDRHFREPLLAAYPPHSKSRVKVQSRFLYSE